ncbi:MAG: hypothetical protein MPJ24_03020 [Pirellulaceae bacterium]|nr:hypothetical protein [Pirellulaceae bacterium]
MTRFERGAQRRRIVLAEGRILPRESQDSFTAKLGKDSTDPKGSKSLRETVSHVAVSEEEKLHNYDQKGRLASQHAWSGFVPVGWLSLTLFYLVPLTLSGLIIAGNEAFVSLPESAKASYIALSLENQGSVGNWFISTLYLFGGLQAGLVYFIRQHRRDDYGGSYRLWLKVSAVLVFASLFSATRLGDSLGAALSSLVEGWVSISGTTLWGIIVSVAIAPLVWKLTKEVVFSKGTLFWLTASLSFYVAGVVGSTLFSAETLAGLGFGSYLWWLSMGGALATFFGTTNYLRYVYFDTQGWLKGKGSIVKEKVARKQVNDKEGDPSASSVRVAAKKAPSKKVTAKVTKAEKEEKAKSEPVQTKEAKKPSGSKKRGAAIRKETATLPINEHKKGAKGKLSKKSESFTNYDDDYEDEEVRQLSERGLSKSQRRRLRKERKKATRAA